MIKERYKTVKLPNLRKKNYNNGLNHPFNLTINAENTAIFPVTDLESDKVIIIPQIVNIKYVEKF